MAKTKIKVVTIRSSAVMDDHTIWVSDALLRKWGISSNQTIQLRFGAFRSRVKVVPTKQVRRVRVNETLAAAMGLNRGAMLRAAYRPSSHTLVVGPLIGVLMPRASAQRPDPFGNTTAFCKELTEAAKEQGAFVYFFPPSGIDENNLDTIRGWTYANGWRQGEFPMPDVIHNRLTSRKLENLPEVQKLFQEAKTRYGAQVFNEKYVDKTEVFSALKQRSPLLRYLPESHAFTGFAQLKSMASKYRTIFLKPIKGSLGKGILRLSRTATGKYLCHYSGKSETRRAEFATLAKAYASISQHTKRQRYQIQQGIAIATVDGRPADFRALVQKGLTGEWNVTSIVGRIAGANHFVSNLAKGGTIAPAKTVIARSNISAGKRATSIASLRKAALEIAKGIESTIDAHFGELGVDLALDQAGRVWLLEVNSKPSKNDNTQLTEGKMRPSVKTLVRYARYLARL